MAAASPDGLPLPFWAYTSSNSIVKSLVERADMSVKEALEELIDGGTIEIPVHEEITYDSIYESDDSLWNFLFFTGYNLDAAADLNAAFDMVFKTVAEVIQEEAGKAARSDSRQTNAGYGKAEPSSSPLLYTVLMRADICLQAGHRQATAGGSIFRRTELWRETSGLQLMEEKSYYMQGNGIMAVNVRLRSDELGVNYLIGSDGASLFGRTSKSAPSQDGT